MDDAKDRLTLGYWLVLAGVGFGLLGMVLPVRSGDVDAASLIENASVALVFGVPILAAGGLAFAAWENQRGWPWPICVVGVLAVIFGAGFGFAPEEGTSAGIGCWFLLMGGALMFVGGLMLSVILRRVRIEAAVATKVREHEEAEALPAPMAALPPEGWYADPQNPTGSRWWSGSGWTDARRADPARSTQAAPPAA